MSKGIGNPSVHLFPALIISLAILPLFYHLCMYMIVCHKHKSSGATVDGTFCEYTVSYVDWLTLIPEKLPSPDAAGFMCAVGTQTRIIFKVNQRNHVGGYCLCVTSSM